MFELNLNYKIDTEALAESIATEILTVGSSEDVECTRAQLMLKDENGKERDMGGRNKTSLKGVILRNLDLYLLNSQLADNRECSRE